MRLQARQNVQCLSDEDIATKYEMSAATCLAVERSYQPLQGQSSSDEFRHNLSILTT